jgi:hypothetical protein
MVVIRFNRNVFTTSYMSDEFIGPGTEVGNDSSSLSSMTCDESDVIRPVMWDWHGEYCEVIPNVYDVK